MNRRRVVWILVLMMALALGSYADIGENFAKGGIGLQGSVSFDNNFYRIADSTDERNYWSLDVAPELNYFVADRAAIGLSPWFFYDSYTVGPDNNDKTMSFGFSFGGYYAFVMNPAAQKGLVFTLGGSLGLSFYPGVADLVAGVEIPDDSMEIDLLLYVTPRLYFFVNDRLAPFVGITPNLIYVLSYKDATGAKVDLTSQERLYMRLATTVGIAWFIPSKKASLFMNP